MHVIARIEEIDERLATMRIENEENEKLFFGDEEEETTNKFELCLVGCFIRGKISLLEQ